MANWGEREDQIIRETYPSHGVKGCDSALRAESFARTPGAIKERAKNLGVRRDRSKIPHENAWSDAELAVLRSVFPEEGAEGTQVALASIGCSRTTGAINTRATMLGLKMRNTKRRMAKGGRKRLVNFVLDEVLDAELITHLDSKRNRSQYIRELVEKDMG
jgi:hypothetical protein